ERALAVLDREPRVVAAISGHAHESSIEPRQSPAGGYWLVQTPSLADYPQQARAFRLVETADGIALETWMIDHSSAGLAAVSRELAYLDAQGGRPRGFAGEAEDRNALLYLER
ncbi:MAG: TIGR03767 family metallophosphoesterase, partial [Solirubrobacterales bacterium]|nr:TIGR03767 family metallophosphoesterase [Solirubrobacterales bacterium]